MYRGEVPTYNNTLTRMENCTLIVGVLPDGSGIVIKNRYGPVGELSFPDLVPILSKVLVQQTGIEFFDDAMQQDLSNSILEVLSRHGLDLKGMDNGSHTKIDLEGGKL